MSLKESRNRKQSSILEHFEKGDSQRAYSLFSGRLGLVIGTYHVVI